MKKILPLVLIFIASLQIFAVEIQSKLAVQVSGEIDKFLEVNCLANDKGFCEQLCSNETSCKIPEVLCEDCVTQKSQLMYSLFTDVNSIFKADIMFIEPIQLIGFLKNKKFISIPHDLFINMFTPEKKEQLKKEFEKLCYINVESAILLATVNENNQATDLVGVVCKDTMGSVVLPVTINPDFSKNQPDFWQKINKDIGYKTEGLKLKMSTELGSIIDSNTAQSQAVSDNLKITAPVSELVPKENCKRSYFLDGTGPLDYEYYYACIAKSLPALKN